MRAPTRRQLTLLPRPTHAACTKKEETKARKGQTNQKVKQPVSPALPPRLLPLGHKPVCRPRRQAYSPGDEPFSNTRCWCKRWLVPRLQPYHGLRKSATCSLRLVHLVFRGQPRLCQTARTRRVMERKNKRFFFAIRSAGSEERGLHCTRKGGLADNQQYSNASNGWSLCPAGNVVGAARGQNFQSSLFQRSLGVKAKC